MFRDTALLLSAFSFLAAAQTHPSGPLSVFLSNAAAASPTVTASMRAELQELLGSSGMNIHWHDGSGNVLGRLAVIRLQGACRSDAPNPLMPHQVSHDPEALGSTHVTNGEVLPFADIRCDHIRRFVAIPLSSAGSAEARDEMLGRAVARVIAHEIYHIVLRTTGHGKKGLARATQSAAQLVSARLTFAQEDERRLSAEGSASPAVADDEISSDRRND
jgi:hypothetical protein